MSSITSALGDSGAKFPFTHDGKTYGVGYLTQRVKAAFGQWLVSGVLATLPQLREALPPAEYRAERDALLREVGAGAFSFYGRAGREALESPEGTLALASLLFGRPRSETDPILAARPEEVRDLLAVVVAESLPRPKPGGPGGGSRPPSGRDIEGMVAALVAHPMRMRFEDVAGLTDRQIVDLVWHPRDDQGRLDLGGGAFDADDGSETPEERRARLRQMARDAGIEVRGG